MRSGFAFYGRMRPARSETTTSSLNVHVQKYSTSDKFPMTLGYRAGPVSVDTVLRSQLHAREKGSKEGLTKTSNSRCVLLRLLLRTRRRGLMLSTANDSLVVLVVTVLLGLLPAEGCHTIHLHSQLEVSMLTSKHPSTPPVEWQMNINGRCRLQLWSPISSDVRYNFCCWELELDCAYEGANFTYLF